MSTSDTPALTNTPIDTYVPIPFPATYPPYNSTTTTPAPSTGSGGTSETVYAAALFIKATCLAGDKLGAWVRAADAAGSVTTTTSSLSYPAIGIIVSKATATSCVVQTYGLCSGIYSGLTPNLRLFVGPTGQASLGSALPSGTAYVQPIGFSVRADTIFVQPSGTLYRRDASASSSDPAPQPSGDSTSSYQPLLHGEGAPDPDVGQLTDLYLASDTLSLYGPKGVDGWGSPRPLATAAAPGAKGDPGTPGSKIYRVMMLPSDGSSYEAGDVLIDDDGNLAAIEST